MNEQLSEMYAAKTAFHTALDDIGISDADFAALTISSAHQFGNGVNYCPAVQQWAV